MKTYLFEGKEKGKILENASKELDTPVENLIIKEETKKEGLLRGKKIILELFRKEDIIEFIKTYLKDIGTLMNISLNMEIRLEDDIARVTLFSEKNAVLIGKDGKNLYALEYLLNQTLYSNLEHKMRVFLDVGEYKIRRQKKIEFNAISIAKKVIRTKETIRLEPMNAYERRLVHTKLVSYSVETLSEGKDPQRYITIKPKTK